MAENNQQFNIQELADKWAQGKLTPEEQAYLEQWYAQFNDEHINVTDSRHENAADLRKAMLDSINAQINRTEKPVQTLWHWTRIAAAASIILAISVGSYFMLHKPQIQQVALLKPGTFKNDVLPGDKAFLTLSNGKKIAVSSAKSGTLAQQGLINIQKTNSGKLIYLPSQNDKAATEPVYNTFTTLRGGGKHSLQLADGTLAVLDAGSSITYPVAFTGKERQVKITGQVYFEVTHNASMPFSVLVKNQVIRDLGTHFNINAYDDEDNIKTTLLEGSISIASDKNKGYTLKPGQQAVAAPDGSIRIRNNVDLGVVVAWKNDLFRFDSRTSLPAVMRQLSRWYDLDVEYDGTKKHYNFGGDIPRTSKLSDVLKILEYSGVQFAVDGKKIIVFQ